MSARAACSGAKSNSRPSKLGVVGGFARGCRDGGITHFALLSAAGSTPKSRIRYARIMGMKEETVREVGFKRLAIFRPGIIGGNAHTLGYAAWIGRLIPGPYGTIEQDDIGRAFVAEFIDGFDRDSVVYLGNTEMKKRSRDSKTSEPKALDPDMTRASDAGTRDALISTPVRSPKRGAFPTPTSELDKAPPFGSASEG